MADKKKFNRQPLEIVEEEYRFDNKNNQGEGSPDSIEYIKDGKEFNPSPRGKNANVDPNLSTPGQAGKPK